MNPDTDDWTLWVGLACLSAVIAALIHFFANEDVKWLFGVRSAPVVSSASFGAGADKPPVVSPQTRVSSKKPVQKTKSEHKNVSTWKLKKEILSNGIKVVSLVSPVASIAGPMGQDYQPALVFGCSEGKPTASVWLGASFRLEYGAEEILAKARPVLSFDEKGAKGYKLGDAINWNEIAVPKPEKFVTKLLKHNELFLRFKRLEEATPTLVTFDMTELGKFMDDFRSVCGWR